MFPGDHRQGTRGDERILPAASSHVRELGIATAASQNRKLPRPKSAPPCARRPSLLIGAMQPSDVDLLSDLGRHLEIPMTTRSRRPHGPTCLTLLDPYFLTLVTGATDLELTSVSGRSGPFTPDSWSMDRPTASSSSLPSSRTWLKES